MSPPHLSCPLACDCPAMASMMASCEYMLIGVLYWAWTMVAFPPGPFTSMGLWVDRAESFRAIGLKLGVYSTLWPPRSGVRGRWGVWWVSGVGVKTRGYQIRRAEINQISM